MNIDTLLAAASKARPAHKRHGKWAQFFPVVTRLRENGFSYGSATDWLIQQKAIAPEFRQKALNAFWQLSHRKAKQTKKQK